MTSCIAVAERQMNVFSAGQVFDAVSELREGQRVALVRVELIEYNVALVLEVRSILKPRKRERNGIEYAHNSTLSSDFLCCRFGRFFFAYHICNELIKQDNHNDIIQQHTANEHVGDEKKGDQGVGDWDGFFTVSSSTQGMISSFFMGVD